MIIIQVARVADQTDGSMQIADDKHVLLAISLLGDICANSNAPNALAAKLLSHSLGLLDVDVYNGN